MKRSVTVVLHHENEYGAAESLTEFLEWIQELIEDVPAEDRKTATIAVGDEAEYGERYAYLEVAYTRLETDDEEAEREAAERREMEARLARERAEFERLKCKFGP